MVPYLNLPHNLFIFGLCKQSKCVIIFGYKHTNDLQVFTILYLHSMSDIRYKLGYPKVMQQKRWQQILHFSLQCELGMGTVRCPKQINQAHHSPRAQEGVAKKGGKRKFTSFLPKQLFSIHLMSVIPSPAWNDDNASALLLFLTLLNQRTHCYLVLD